MPYTSSFHTVEPGAPHVFHNNSACQDGKNIRREHQRPGPGEGRRLCERCSKLNAEGK